MATPNDLVGLYVPYLTILCLLFHCFHSHATSDVCVGDYTRAIKFLPCRVPVFPACLANSCALPIVLWYSTEDTTAVAEEWMYSNTFLVDLEESFNRWRLIELSLPVRLSRGIPL